MFLVFNWIRWYHDNYRRRQQREVMVELEIGEKFSSSGLWRGLGSHMEPGNCLRENPRPFGCEMKDGGRVGVVSMNLEWSNLVGVLSWLLTPSLTTGLLLHL